MFNFFIGEDGVENETDLEPAVFRNRSDEKN